MSENLPPPTASLAGENWVLKEGSADRREMSIIHRAGDEEYLIAYVITESMNKFQRADDLNYARALAAAPVMFRQIKKALEWMEARSECRGDDAEIAALAESIAGIY